MWGEGGSLFSAGRAARKVGVKCVWGWVAGTWKRGGGSGGRRARRVEGDEVKDFGGCCRWFEVVKVPLIVTAQWMLKLPSTFDLSTGGRHAWESFSD